MTDSATRERVRQELQKLVGLELATTNRAADLRGFHFSDRREGHDRIAEDLALHIQCPWRIDGPAGVLTGRSDLWQPVEPLQGESLERWDYERDGNLQDRRVADWLGQQDERRVSNSTPENRLIVLAARATPYGGAEIDLSGGYCLSLFPAGSIGEEWRLFRLGDDAPHFVVEGGGRIEIVG